MKDQLEDFVHRNRAAFDDKEPSERVWKNIHAATQQGPRTTVWNSLMLWRAAAVVFMALSGYLLYQKTTAKPAVSEVAANEFRDVERFYFNQISEKVQLIDEFQKNEGLNGFTQDFQQLEAMYSVLKEEMKAHPSQKVKDALVLNLLIRIDLLNQQLHALEKKEDESYKDKKEKKEESV
jgi:hypothetical protein